MNWTDSGLIPLLRLAEADGESAIAQFHVMLEFCVIEKVVDISEPEGGTEPVPIQPVQA